ncbi:MAG: cupin domain-containing protein [Nitrospinota bacterium]
MTRVTDWDHVPTKEAFPGVNPKIVSGEYVMVSFVRARKGAKALRHHHEAEQILCVLKGRVRAQSEEGPVRVLGPGDIWYVPSHAEHQVDYLEDTEALEACSPIRRDNFAGYLANHTHRVPQRNLEAEMERQRRGPRPKKRP